MILSSRLNSSPLLNCSINTQKISRKGQGLKWWFQFSTCCLPGDSIPGSWSTKKQSIHGWQVSPMHGSVPTKKLDWLATGQTLHELTCVTVKTHFFFLVKAGPGGICIIYATIHKRTSQVMYQSIVTMFHFFQVQLVVVKLFPNHINWILFLFLFLF